VISDSSSSVMHVSVEHFPVPNRDGHVGTVVNMPSCRGVEYTEFSVQAL
jgi:hypothetical protein